MSNTNRRLITQSLSLQPLGRLNSTLAAHGLEQHAVKVLAVDALADLVESGSISLAGLTAEIVAAPVFQSSQVAGLTTTDKSRLDDALNTANKASAEAQRTFAQASNDRQAAQQLAAKIERTLSGLEQAESSLSASVDGEIARLTKSISEQVAAVGRPDPAQVSNEIRAQVTALFDQFRVSSTLTQLQTVAAKLGAFRFERADVVFGPAACRYAEIDFGAFQVSVWDDPSAPALVDDYEFNPATLHQVLIATQKAVPIGSWLGGERGTGKTEFVTQFAARCKRRLCKVSFDDALERADFIGADTIVNGSVEFREGLISQAIQHPGAVVLLDECGQARPNSLACLHAPLERNPNRALVLAETGRRIPVAEYVCFFAADNSLGHGDSSGNYAGVRLQNSAFLDRFGLKLAFTFLPADKEAALISSRTGLPIKAAAAIVQVATVARQKAQAGLLTQPPSLRQLLVFAELVQDGCPLELAFNSTVINAYPEDCHAELLGIFASQINTAEFLAAV